MTASMFTLCPYRFSDDPPRMIAFLTTLGMYRVVGSPEDTFAVLAGRSGRVAVHSSSSSASGALPGETQLCFETPDADDASRHLKSLGRDATVVDEAYGRHVHVADWRELRVGINEEMIDFYGYRRHDEPEQPGPVSVVGAWYRHNLGPAEAALRQLGYATDGPASDGRQTFRGSGPRGVVGLHAAGSRSEHSRTGLGLGFETLDAPDDLVERLRAAGYADAELASVQGATIIVVTDPDGQRIEIHPAPR